MLSTLGGMKTPHHHQSKKIRHSDTTHTSHTPDIEGKGIDSTRMKLSRVLALVAVVLAIASLPALADDSAPAADEAEGGTDAAAAVPEPPVQSGPFIDLLGETLQSLEMVDEQHAQILTHYTNEALAGKKVIGLYFSADW